MKSISLHFITGFIQQCKANLVESDPVPCAGSERLQSTVDNHGIDVCAPVSLRLEVHQRRLIHLPELERQDQRYTKSSVNGRFSFTSRPHITTTHLQIQEDKQCVRAVLTSSVKTPITGL